MKESRGDFKRNLKKFKKFVMETDDEASVNDGWLYGKAGTTLGIKMTPLDKGVKIVRKKYRGDQMSAYGADREVYTFTLNGRLPNGTLATLTGKSLGIFWRNIQEHDWVDDWESPPPTEDFMRARGRRTGESFHTVPHRSESIDFSIDEEGQKWVKWYTHKFNAVGKTKEGQPEYYHIGILDEKSIRELEKKAEYDKSRGDELKGALSLADVSAAELGALSLKEGGFDSSKLMVHDTLNSKFWENGKLKSEVTKKLMEIAQDFHELLKQEVPSLPDFENITFTGSLASYNYHNLSDIDLHVLIDFRKFEKNPEILEKYLIAKRIQWNKDHKIMIFGHEVEIYIQDTSEEHFANGVYSILTQDWIEMPIKELVDIDFGSTKKKYNAISKEIKELSSMFGEKKFNEVYEYTIKLKEKIKRMRQAGLAKEGAYSSENLAFKMLRINNELDILNGLKISSYDNMKSLRKNRNQAIKINITENWKNFLNLDG